VCEETAGRSAGNVEMDARSYTPSGGSCPWGKGTYDAAYKKWP